MQLKISIEAAAAGIYDTVNAEMTDSLRLATVRKGLDPRDFAIVAAGGAGPLHAAALASDLDVRLVVVPRNASVLCAGGMLLSDYVRFYVRTVFGRSETPTAERLQATFVELETTATREFSAEGVNPQTLRFIRTADVRYVGQVHEISVPIEGGELDEAEYEAILSRFHKLHLERFGHAQSSEPVEIINLRVQANGVTQKPAAAGETALTGSAEPKGFRRAWFGGRWRETPVYAGLSLPSDAEISWPSADRTADQHHRHARVVHPYTFPERLVPAQRPARDQQPRRRDRRRPTSSRGGLTPMNDQPHFPADAARTDGADPVLAAVIENRLHAIAAQMAETMLLTSRSLIFQVRDFVTGVITADGLWVATKDYIPVLAGSLTHAYELIAKRFAGDIHDGDVFILNDVYHGNNHPPDVSIMKPVFHRGELRFWAITKGHNADVGGGGVVGYNPYARDVWEDSLRIPPVRIIHKGALQRDVWETHSA